MIPFLNHEPKCWFTGLFFLILFLLGWFPLTSTRHKVGWEVDSKDQTVLFSPRLTQALVHQSSQDSRLLPSSQSQPMKARNESCLACRHHLLCVPQCPGQQQSGMEGAAVPGTPAEDLLCPEVRCRTGDGETVLCLPGQTEDLILWVVCAYFFPAINSFYIWRDNKMVSSLTASVYFGCKHQATRTTLNTHMHTYVWTVWGR